MQISARSLAINIQAYSETTKNKHTDHWKGYLQRYIQDKNSMFKPNELDMTIYETKYTKYIQM